MDEDYNEKEVQKKEPSAEEYIYGMEVSLTNYFKDYQIPSKNNSIKSIKENYLKESEKKEKKGKKEKKEKKEQKENKGFCCKCFIF